MNNSGIVVLLIFFSCSCNNENNHYYGKNLSVNNLKHNIMKIAYENSPVCYYDIIMKRNELVDILEIIPDIIVELKYSTDDNFLNKDVYGCLQKAYLQPEVADMLKKSQFYLKSLNPDLTLLVYDAARPVDIQHKMWEMLDMPFNEKIKYLSNPKNGSIHNFGVAVDVTLAYLDGDALDMGTPFDYFGELAFPSKEKILLEQGLLTEEQVENRKLLRKVMYAGGFYGIQSEWWHFNAMNRKIAIELYEIIK